MTTPSSHHDAGNGPAAPLTLGDRVRSLRLPDTPPRGRGASAWLPWTLCALLAGSTAYLGYRTYGSTAEEESPRVETPTASPSNPAPAPTASSGEVVLESKGYVIPTHQIQVSPKVGGMVIKLYFEEGKRVKKGDKLAELETDDYQADHDRAVAFRDSARQRLEELLNGNRPEEIQQAKSELEECAAQREQLYLEWKRNVNLKTGQALAQREYEQAYAAYRAMERRESKLKQAYDLMVLGPRRERIEAVRAELRQAEADMVKAKWRLDNTIVTAPVSGTILTKKAEEGNIVNPAAFSNGLSASLCDMADLSDLEVDLTIQERDVARVFKGQRCRLRAEAYPDRVYQGHVSRLMPIADRAKGAVPVRVKVQVPREEEGVYLKPDMSVQVSFLKKE